MDLRVGEVVEEQDEEEVEAVAEVVVEEAEVLVEGRQVGEAEVGEATVVADLEAAEEVDALAEGHQGAEQEEEAGDVSKVRLRISEPIQNTDRDCEQATLLINRVAALPPEPVILSFSLCKHTTPFCLLFDQQ
jgi:hypothetical protein